MSKAKRTILFTFDHELFLGVRSGTVEKCMIEPVDELLRIAGEFNVSRFIFFLDTTYLARLKKENGELFQTDYQTVKRQVKRLLSEGHYIFPHIHPHWLDAVPLDQHQWKLTDLSRYCFKNCTPVEQRAIWEETMEVLSDLGVPACHPVDGFRSGGWSIQPFEDFRPFFEQYGIRYDFSVLPGARSMTNAQQYDFTPAPRKSFYRFENRVEEEVARGAFAEIPISVRDVPATPPLGLRILLKVLHRTGNRSFGDGQGIIPVATGEAIAANPVEMISLELLNRYSFRSYCRFLDRNECMHFISHPKMLTPHHLKFFRKFLQYAANNYNLEFDFKSLVH